MLGLGLDRNSLANIKDFWCHSSYTPGYPDLEVILQLRTPGTNLVTYFSRRSALRSLQRAWYQPQTITWLRCELLSHRKCETIRSSNSQCSILQLCTHMPRQIFRLHYFRQSRFWVLHSLIVSFIFPWVLSQI